MWLLRADTFELHEFVDPAHAPPYAILSHTWGEQEVSFKDVQDIAVAQSKIGFAKIGFLCQQANRDGMEWAWVDTCCIDKSSSAELSEAINSMFAIYEQAVRCYVYMEDVGEEVVNLSDDMDPHGILDGGSGSLADEHHAMLSPLKVFCKSRWFTRGWTLQELLAPPAIQFRNRHWGLVGSLQGLLLTVSRVTRIDHGVLLGRRSIESCCIAEKFSWAAYRVTTRIEDLAYSLLGICGINMPLLYGERSNAFKRLQEELIRTSEDRSIFAWHGSGRQRTRLVFQNGRPVAETQAAIQSVQNQSLLPCKLLASSPAAFADCGNVAMPELSLRSVTPMTAMGFDWTKSGIRAQLPLLPVGAESKAAFPLFIALLGCEIGSSISSISASLGLLLRSMRKSGPDGLEMYQLVGLEIPAMIDGTEVVSGWAFEVTGLPEESSLTNFHQCIISTGPHAPSKAHDTFRFPRIPGFPDAPHPDISLSLRTNGVRVVAGYPEGTLNMSAALSSLQGIHQFAAVVVEATTRERAAVVFFADRTPLGAYFVLLKFATIDTWEAVRKELVASTINGASTDILELVSLLDSTTDKALSLNRGHQSTPVNRAWVAPIHYAAREGDLPARGGRFRASCKTMSDTLQHVAITFLPYDNAQRTALPMISGIDNPKTLIHARFMP